VSVKKQKFAKLEVYKIHTIYTFTVVLYFGITKNNLRETFEVAKTLQLLISVTVVYTKTLELEKIL